MAAKAAAAKAAAEAEAAAAFEVKKVEQIGAMREEVDTVLAVALEALTYLHGLAPPPPAASSASSAHNDGGVDGGFRSSNGQRSTRQSYESQASRSTRPSHETTQTSHDADDAGDMSAPPPAPAPNAGAAAPAAPAASAAALAADQYAHLASCAHAMTLLDRHPRALTLLFHGYSTPLEPRPPSAANALVALADTGASVGVGAGAARSAGVRHDDHSPYASELRGVCAAGVGELLEDFNVVHALSSRTKWAAHALASVRAARHPLSLLQLVLLLLQGYAYGTLRAAAAKSLEIDGLADDGGGGHGSAADSPDAGVRAVESALCLHAPRALTARLLAFGRRLPAAALLLPLPLSSPLLFEVPSLLCLRTCHHEILARQLHALVALADADDRRVDAEAPLTQLAERPAPTGLHRTIAREFVGGFTSAAIGPASTGAAHRGGLTRVMSNPMLTRYRPHPALHPALNASGPSIVGGARGSGMEMNWMSAASMAAPMAGAPRELIHPPLHATPKLPADVAALTQQAGLLAAEGDAAGSLEALRRARRALADWASPPGSDEPFPTDAAIFLPLAMARACAEDTPRQALSMAATAWLTAVRAAPDDPRHVDVCNALATMAFTLRRYEVGAALFARALAALAARPHCDALDAAAAYNNLACCAAALGDLAAAETLYRKCHALLITDLKPSHPATATVLRNLSRHLALPGTRTPETGERQPMPPARFFTPGPKLPKEKKGKKGGGKKDGGKSPKKRK